MKSITILFMSALVSLAHAESVSISYSKPIVTVAINGKAVIEQKYEMHSSYSIGAELLLQSMQLVYVVGQCIIVNNDKELPTESHTPAKGDSIVYSFDGTIIQKLNFPLRGKFISPLSNQWAISINNLEGEFNSYTMLSSQCKVMEKKLDANYKVYDGYEEFYNQDSIVLLALETYPSTKKNPTNILINEHGFKIE